MLILRPGQTVYLVTKSICEKRRDKCLANIKNSKDIDKATRICNDKYNACIQSIGKPIKRR